MKNISFHADDYNYDEKSDLQMEQLNNKVDLISILPNFKKPNKHSLLKKNINLALHVNLVEGKPLTGRRFLPLPILLLRAFFGQIDKAEIEKEIEAQIMKLKRAGVKIYELNSHQHVHAFYPFSNVVIKLAQKYSIKRIRSYKNIKCFTVKAKLTLMMVRFLAILSNVFGGKGFSFPSTWYIKNTRKDVYMSWEGPSFDFSEYKGKEKLNLIVHPGLPFDSNKSYYKILR